MGFGESNGSNENPEEKTASLPVTGVEALPRLCHPPSPRLRPGRQKLATGWRDERDDFAFVSPIDAKVFVHGDDTVLWMQLAHPNETEIGKVRFAILVTLCQSSQVSEMIVTDKMQPDEFFGDHLQDETGIAQVECGFGQDRFASQ